MDSESVHTMLLNQQPDVLYSNVVERDVNLLSVESQKKFYLNYETLKMIIEFLEEFTQYTYTYSKLL